VETVFVTKLKSLFDAVAEEMTLYVPKKLGEYYSFSRYDPSDSTDPEFNNIRASSPAKEFLFPMRELAATFGGGQAPSEKKIEPFAVFGLKNCDLRSIRVLDCVFAEDEFLDPFYVARRESMFIIAGDCFDPAQTCFCNLFEGQPFAREGFDLNLSKVKDGFIVEAGSEKGTRFIKDHGRIFTDVPSDVVAVRDENRKQAQARLDEINAEYALDNPIKDIVENSYDSPIFEEEAGTCVECQACTRVCPTCHCFYLYDSKQKDYFAKTKIWDSCLRRDYATVAGGQNPRKILGDRSQQRLLHKFVYFLERYGIEMCVGCGRCIEGCAGGTKMREVLKKLNEELKDKKETKAVS
jgi:heterodisulfide reductase subunit C